MIEASLVVLAYNKLPYTQLCIDSIYNYTQNIDYELITVNNGSNDGTKEYLDSLPNEKKLSYDTNVGIEKAINDAIDISEGKYFVLINNDIILTHNWLNNIITIFESDPKVGAVVPACNCSVNDQVISAEYYTTTQLQEFAKSYNTSDPRKWEERLDLTMYLVTFRTDELKSLGGLDPAYHPAGHDDDDLSFRYRRAGYKLIFTRDTYVHHYGGITMKDIYSDHNHMTSNLQYFISKFGVNIYDVIPLDYNVLNSISYDKKGSLDFLSIGKTCGNTMLRCKNKLKEVDGVTHIKLSYYALDQLYITDLKTVYDCVFYNTLDNIAEELGDSKFDYIYIEQKLELIENPEILLEKLTKHLKDDGELIFLFTDITPSTQLNYINSSQITTKVVLKQNLDNLLKVYGYSQFKISCNNNEHLYIVKYKNLLSK